MRPELRAELSQLLFDLVPFDGHGGSVQPDLGAVGQYGAAGIGGGELDEAGRDEVWRDDDRAGVGRHLDIVLDGHRDLHVGGPGFDRVDLADRDTHHSYVVAGVQADRGREVGDHLVAAA